MIRHLHKDHEHQIGMRGRRSSSVVLHNSQVTARAGQSKDVGHFIGMVDVELVVAVIHHVFRAVARARPFKRVGRLMGSVERPM